MVRLHWVARHALKPSQCQGLSAAHATPADSKVAARGPKPYDLAITASLLLDTSIN